MTLSEKVQRSKMSIEMEVVIASSWVCNAEIRGVSGFIYGGGEGKGNSRFFS